MMQICISNIESDASTFQSRKGVCGELACAKEMFASETYDDETKENF
jgi:hypothetical protein